MNPTPPEGLENEVAELRLRVRRLEEALYRQGIVAERWKVPSGESAAPVQAPTPGRPPASSVAPPSGGPTLPAAVPVFASVEAHSNTEERSLESRIGSQWFNRIGILAVLIAMAWFLKLAIDNHWIGPLGRVLIGLIAGAGLIAWSERFRVRGYRVFSYSLKSIGSGVLYLSVWAAFSLYHLIPSPVAFAAMVAITAFNAYLSWAQDAELLALYAIAGGFSTPMLVSTGENHEVALFGYMLLLDLAVLLLVALRPWSRLLFGAFMGTVFYVTAWALEFYSASQAWATAFFVGCFFMLFALAPRLVCVRGQDTEKASFNAAWDKLVTVLLPLLNAGLGFWAFYLILGSRQSEIVQPWLAVAFAGFYLMLLSFPAKGRWRENPALLADLHMAVAVVFLTIAIPLKASGRWITTGWLVEGAALLWVASRTRMVLMRVLAVGCMLLSLGALMVVNPHAAPTLIFNQRFATFAVAIAAFAISGWIASRQSADESRDAVLPWPSIALACALLVNVLILTAVSLEIHAYWGAQRLQVEPAKFVPNAMYAQFSYSAFFMLFGAVLLALGFSRHSALLRWQALVLIAFSIGKVFLVDVSELSQGYRILSFLGLGVLLLAVSFVYQRDWFNLRGRGGHAS